MPDDAPRPRDPVVARLVALGTLVTALAGLATAIWKPQDQTVTRAAYQQCTAGIEKLNDGLAQEHQELATLRGYVAAKDGQPLLAQPPIASFDAGASPAPGAPTTAAPPPRRPARPPAAPSAPAATSLAAGPPPPAAAEPPPVSPAPAAFHPQDFDTVLKSAK